jgi:hypothetical protein
MPNNEGGPKAEEVEKKVTRTNEEAEDKELSDEDLENVAGSKKIIGIDLGTGNDR